MPLSVSVLDIGPTLKAFPDQDWLKMCGLKISLYVLLTFNIFSSLIQDGNPELRMTLRRSYRHKFEL